MNCELGVDVLCRFFGDELAETERRSVQAHVAECGDCARMLEAFRASERALQQVGRIEPKPAVLLDVRRAVARERQHHNDDSLMTMDEVAEYLRLGPDEFERVAARLPAFEFAGRILVRRSQLMKWIRQRERAYANAAAGSLAADDILTFPGEEGVA